jgi:hypothetical protein
MPSFHLGYARLQVSSSGNLVVYMRDTRTSCALTSLHSAYAVQKNASSGILILWIHRDARCSCVQTRACAHLRSLRKGSHPASAKVEPPFKVTSPENKKTTR